MLERLGPALALVLVIEGILPLFSPPSWRTTIRRIADLADGLREALDPLCEILCQLADRAFLAIVTGDVITAVIDDDVNFAHLIPPRRSSGAR